jgi:hypothetical protein
MWTKRGGEEVKEGWKRTESIVCSRLSFFLHCTYKQEKEAVLYVLEAEFWLQVRIITVSTPS